MAINYVLINQACMAALLCIGFSFILNMEKFPNFAHFSVASWGATFMFTLIRFFRLYLVQALIYATLLSGLLGMALYLLVVRPLRKFGGFRDVTLTLASLGISWILRSISLIYSYWSNVLMRTDGLGFRGGGLQFKIFEVPANVAIGVISSLGLMIAMYVFLSKNRTGIAMRAVAEDEGLAASVGINTYSVHISTWLLMGALGGFAGCLMSLGGGGYPDSDQMFVIVMAGSFLGGINSVFGAAIGGFSITIIMSMLPKLVENILGGYLISAFGSSFDLYRITVLLPYVVLYAVLLYEPEGIVGIISRFRVRIDKLSRKTAA